MLWGNSWKWLVWRSPTSYAAPVSQSRVSRPRHPVPREARVGMMASSTVAVYRGFVRRHGMWRACARLSDFRSVGRCGFISTDDTCVCDSAIMGELGVVHKTVARLYDMQCLNCRGLRGPPVLWSTLPNKAAFRPQGVNFNPPLYMFAYI